MTQRPVSGAHIQMEDEEPRREQKWGTIYCFHPGVKTRRAGYRSALPSQPRQTSMTKGDANTEIKTFHTHDLLLMKTGGNIF